MSQYEVVLSKHARKDRAFWQKTSDGTFQRLLRILDELEVHPCEGIGKPEKLKNIKDGWSRRLTLGDRVEYRIRDKEVLVNVISARGHYDDH